MNTDLPPAVRRLADLQDGVLAVRQLQGHVSQGHVRAQLAARRWQRVGRRVVVLHNGPLTDRQKVWAALLAAPKDAVASGPTAMGLDGVADAWATGIHITIPCGHRAPEGVGATVHWSNFLGEADVHPAAAPRRTRLPRSILDWAAWQPRDERARVVVLRGLQSRKVTAAKLREALPSRGPCRHHGVITESIDDGEGGIASVPERDFRELVVAAGLPRPSHQVLRQRPSGRCYLDADWEEYGLSAEVQGVHHFDVEQREADLERQNDLVVEGESLLQFTSFAVRHRGPVVAGTLRRALYRRGWTEGLGC